MSQPVTTGSQQSGEEEEILRGINDMSSDSDGSINDGMIQYLQYNCI